MVWISLCFAAPEVVSSTVDEGKLADRLSDVPADLVILYGGEQDGALGTCGCPGDPKGSVGRVQGYADALRQVGTPLVLLNAGNWLTDPVGPDNGLRSDAYVRNAYMLEGMAGWDALNVSFRDLPWLGETHRFPAEAVSANIGSAPNRYRIVERDGVKVALTGVTAWKKAWLQPEGFEQQDPVDALKELLPTLRSQADLIVVSSYGLGRRTRDLTLLDIDVLVDADTHRSRAPAVVDHGTLWVRSRFETQYLGELRLELGEHGIESAHDRAIALDKKIPTAPGFKKRERAATKALESI